MVKKILKKQRASPSLDEMLILGEKRKRKEQVYTTYEGIVFGRWSQDYLWHFCNLDKRGPKKGSQKKKKKKE